MSKPSAKALLAYARVAVRNEMANPYHGRFAGYDYQAVQVDILNHFDNLTNSDEDEDLILDAQHEAEDLEGIR